MNDIVSEQGNTLSISAENSDVLYKALLPGLPCPSTTAPRSVLGGEKQTSGPPWISSTDINAVGDSQSANKERDEQGHGSQSRPREAPCLPHNQNPSPSNHLTDTETLPRAGSQDENPGASIPESPKRKHRSNKAPKVKAKVGSKKRKLFEQPIMTDCTIPVQETYGHFMRHCQNPNNACFLTQLFYGIGSQNAFVQLKNTALHLRSNKLKIPFARANSVFENMRSLDQLASSVSASIIMERYLLVQLVDQRNELVDEYKPQSGRRLRMVTESRTRLPRTEGLAFKSMMKKAFPLLDEGTEGYKAGLTTLQNRLSKARNLHTLKEMFGRDILALIPVDGDWQINDRE
ncbi:uncharacterized protein BDV17DRAFT_213090 [Aspergillus undulatus]|uniref:uncharacterized protein n=1 Tax=Aspergillus undulatus TaxID=1810928 RepID=UPI003CCCF8BD